MSDRVRVGAVGGLVRNVHERLAANGIDVPAGETCDHQFGLGTAGAVERFQRSVGLPATGVVDDATANALGLREIEIGPVTGVVTRADGAPAAGVTVRIVRRGFLDGKVVATTTSGTDGAFTLPWPAGLFGGLALVADGGKPQPVAPNVAVRISTGSPAPATRFATLVGSVTPVLDGTQLAAVVTAQEIGAIGDASALPAHEVSQLVLAHKLAAKSKVDPAVFFALFSQRVPATVSLAFEDGVAFDDAQIAHALAQVLELREDNIARALDAAVVGGAIAGVDLAAAKQKLHALRIDHLGSQPFQVGKTAFRDVLATALLAPAVTQALEAYAAHGTTAEFWTQLETSGMAADARADLNFTLKTSVLVRNHLPLLRDVQQRRKAGELTKVSDLARLDAADWGARLRAVDPNAEHLTFTANLNFATIDQRIDHFAQMLAAQFERRYPTAAFAGRLPKHADALNLTAPAELSTFLDGNPTFSLRRTNIDAYRKEHAASDAVTADLKKVQRIYRLTRRFDHAKAMLAVGHTSARSIYSTGRTRFVAQMTAAGATRRAARSIYARAESVHATTLAMLGNFNRSLTRVAPAAVAQPISAAALAPLLAGFPDLQSLFGATDYCSCADCRSIYGSAAYLVDILEFLRHRIATGSTTARDVLFERRADLGAIELSCANTTGVLPYIDLACEVLEDAVAAPTPDVVRARQTTGTADERRASPQFVNQAAYTTLRDAVFPIAAPFDLWATEVRAFLGKLGVPWHELLSAFQTPTTGPADVDIAGERLGFDRRCLAIVTTAAPAQPWKLWGLAETGNSIADPQGSSAPITGTWLEVLAHVPVVLQRTGLTQRELVQLLATRFITAAGAITIVENADDGFAHCDTGRQSIAGWTAGALTRFVRFVRLQRRLGRRIWDLDKALVEPKVGGAELDAAAIVAISQLEAIAGQLGLDWDEALGLWSPIDHAYYLDVLGDSDTPVPSTYARRFRNATVMQASTVFVADPAHLTGLLGDADVVAGLAAALGLASDDIRRIRAAAGLAAPAAALDLPSLSTIFRYAMLARGLRLGVADLIVAIGLAGVDPFADVDSTRAFLDALSRATATGFTLRELDYLLRHGSLQESGIAITDSAIAVWLEDLRRGFVRASGNQAELVAQRISDLLPLDPALTRRVLAMLPPALFADPQLVQREADGTFVIASTRATFPSIFDAFVLIDKLRIVIARWRLSTRDASWLLDQAAGVGWLALSTLPANAAGSPVDLLAFVALRRNVVVQQTLVAANETRLFDVVLARTQPRDTVAAALAAVGGFDTADVIAIADRFGWTTGAALVEVDRAATLRDLVPWARRLGTDVATTLGFVTTDVAAPQADQIRQLTKAKYAIEVWYTVAGAIEDEIREHKRAALVAWLLANPNTARGQHWFTIEELYGFYLIDPEMTAVATTTRLKQAAASIQLFVQRCFLQLEPAISVDAASDSGWQQWEWMKRFRLWEANRKIFLYPENWIDPSQRGGTSDFFSELEAELQQCDIDETSAEEALANYVHKLVEVSNLEICGVCEQNDYGQRLLHVIARTRKTPHVHYYRRLGATGVWSPWEKLDLEIASEHVLPVYWNRRLHVFWPELARKSLSTASDRSVPPGGGGTSPAPTEYWEIALAWVERRGDRWMPVRKTDRLQLAISNRARYFTLKAPTVGRRLEVELYSGKAHYAQWQLTGNEDQPVLLHAGLPAVLQGLEEATQLGVLTPAQKKPTLSRPATLDWYFNALVGGAPGVTSTLSLLEGSPQQELTLLGKISQPRVMAEHQTLQFTSQGPFFLSDPKRTFFVTPSFVATTVYSRHQPSGTTTFTTQYTPAMFYHPYTDLFMEELAYGGVDGLYARAIQLSPDTLRGTPPFDFAAEYAPTPAIRQRLAPEPAYPVETIDYSHGGAYAAYNWELFFHIPLLIAKRLADNQRFAEALRWFHYIFNPTTTTGGTVPQRYWIPRVFHDLTAVDYDKQQIEKLLQLVNQGDAELAQKIAEWRSDPFDPHLIAASRPVAYQKAVVMQYISTLIAWGDQLFRGDTIESINEATQLYLLASQLLGPRPQRMRSLEPSVAQTYKELAPQLDAFGNAAVEIENVISIPPPGGPPASAPLPQLHTFYFCIPPNENLLAYWDTVADRLFKIRHGLNVEGVARTLALYEPAIDPGLLIRAAAAGIDVSTVIADVGVAQPCYRFTASWQIAHELAQDVRAFGAAILSALERRDAEAMARLQATQELALLDKVRSVKQDQVAEAKANQDALAKARELTEARHAYYDGRDKLNAGELMGLVLGGAAVGSETAATILEMVASAAYPLGYATFGAAGFGGSPVATVSIGGGSVASSAASAATTLRTIASLLNQSGSLATAVGGYERRLDEWHFQRDQASKELEQIDHQLIAANIRAALVQHDLDAHDRQRGNAQNVADLLTSRFTSRELYDWILSQLSTTYFQAYELAYDLAKRASRAYAFELGDDPGYIQFGYWDSLHKGLSAGDKLVLDMRRLQAAFFEHNRRELELSKHVSLLQLDPLALVRLRQTGECFINLPESVFDLDQPGHYRRRLKTVGVTLPCVTGPYTTVNATLTLLSHATRVSSDPGTQYLPAVDADGMPGDDPRFVRVVGAVDAIALSTGREDAGMFEVNFHDERYLPFEGLGAISHWRLELPHDTNRFDISTLTDVVLHLRYTARDGGVALRDAARTAVIGAMPRIGVQLLSAKSEFPDAWARLFAPRGTGQALDVALESRHFPFQSASRRIQITSVAVIMLFEDDRSYAAYQTGPALLASLGGSPASFVADATLGQLPVATVALTGAVAPITLALAEGDIAAVPLLVVDEDGHHRLNRSVFDDILVMVRYRIEDAP